MNNIPHELKYTKSHEWVRDNGDGTFTIGITDHAQELLGDMVFIEQPEIGTELEAGEECGVVESVKAASDMYAPISGEVISINDALEDAPELVNSDAYHEGFIFTLRASDDDPLAELLDAQAYEALLAEEDH
jgi:glycine cleavage system H protein